MFPIRKFALAVSEDHQQRITLAKMLNGLVIPGGCNPLRVSIISIRGPKNSWCSTSDDLHDPYFDGVVSVCLLASIDDGR